MDNSRSKKSFINIITGVGYQIFTILISFVSRTIFIHTLGSGYLGISSLFTNILSVLSLAELGIGTAMFYCMYEPLATNDRQKLASLIRYFKKLYIFLAGIVFISGLIVIPFLRYIVNLSTDITYIRAYFFLYLLDTVVSYLCVYKTSILTADQKDYIIKLCRTLFDITRLIVQLLILILLKNFTLYLIVQIVCSMGNNIIATVYVNKKYSYVNQPSVVLPKSERKQIWNNIRAMFSYKVGGVILNNTDQLLISMLVCTEAVGLYSNYYMPIKSIMGVTSTVFIAVQASIGNLAVEKSSKRQFEIFKLLDLCSFWLYGFFTICFCVLLQDFIVLWIGDSYLLSNELVYIIACTYYLTGVLYPIWCYRETVGLFQHTKNIMFYASFLNIIFSIILGKKFGLEGIFAATIIARILTNIWFEPYKLFSIYFKEKVRKYYLQHILEAFYIFGIVVIIKILAGHITISNGYMSFIIKGIVCVVVSNIMLVLAIFKTNEFKEMLLIVKRMLKLNRKK